MSSNPQRFAFPPASAPTPAPALPAPSGDPRLAAAIDLAHRAGVGLGRARRWVESEGIGKRPMTTLGVAFGLGLFTGWLIKR